MTWNVVLSFVVTLHQLKHFLEHIRLGRKIELSRWIGLDRSKCELTLVGNQIRQNRMSLWLVAEQMGWFVLSGDFDGRMTRKLGFTLQNCRLVNGGLNTLDKLLLKLS